jgi:hypothetical protein
MLQPHDNSRTKPINSVENYRFGEAFMNLAAKTAIKCSVYIRIVASIQAVGQR